MSACFFCTLTPDRIIGETENFVVIRDMFPVTEGHRLIITKRHVENFFDLTPAESHELTDILHDLKNRMMTEDTSITGFNIGMNCGVSAGQTVMHFHCHLIARRDGDMTDPKGGVRGVIPEKQKY